MTHLRIKLLGKPEIIHDGRSVSFRTRKALALLIYLVVEGGTHSRASLATLFWPESDPGAGRATLRSTLRYLRTPLEHEADRDTIPHLNVARDALGFNFDSDYELDLERVEAAAAAQSDGRQLLQQAVDAYRGYFLQGFSLPDAPDFDDWAGFQREHWHLRLSEVFARLSQMQAQAGETSAAMETTRRWVAFEPLKEAAYRRLMRLQLAAGDRPGALQTYQTCRKTLAEELSIEPAPETKALAERVEDAQLQDEPDAQKARLDAESADLASSSTLLQAKSPFPFVGRRRQHTRLMEAYYGCRSERAQVAIVEGEAGIGKTRLAQEFLGWASAQGAEILRGRGFETGGRLPYQPLVEALRPLTSGLPDLLSPTWLGELTRILPDLDELVAGLPSPTSDENLGRSRLFEAVARFGIELAANDPAVLFVDDLQWVDTGTPDPLTYVARRWSEQEAQILLLGAIRAEALHRAAVSEPLLEWLRGLEREPGTIRLELEALTQGEMAQFVERAIHPQENRAQAEAFSQWLFRETRGQPFYLTETIKALLEEEILVFRPAVSGRSMIGFSPRVAESVSWDEVDPLQDFVPPGVRDVVRDRLARLSSSAFDLLVAGAILGQAFDFQGLCRIADLPRSKALTVLDGLLGTRLLAEAKQEERPYTFAHDKIRDVVYTEAGDARRRVFHERALAYLEEKGAPAAQLAHHAYGGGAYGTAFRHSLQAGDEAMDVFAVRDAVFHFERARRTLIEHPQISEEIDPARRRHMYERLGRAHELVNDWDAAQAVYEEMLADAREAEWPEMEVAALNRLAAVKGLWQLDLEEALTILQEARAVAQASGDRRGLAEAEWGTCMSKLYGLDRPVALEHGERAVALAREIGDRELIAKGLNAAGYAAPCFNLWGEVEDYGQEASTLYAEVGNRAMEADSLLLVTWSRINVGRAASGVQVARRALQISREIENEWGEVNSLTHLAAGLLEMGNYGQALNSVHKAFSFKQFRHAALYVSALTIRGMVYRALQVFEQALDDHLRADEDIREMMGLDMFPVLSAHLCADYAYLGQWDKAYEQARITIQSKDLAWYYAGFHYWTVVEALLRGGDEAAAEGDVAALEEAVGHFPRHKIVVERSKAALFRWKDEFQRANASLETALRIAEELSLPGEQWPLLAELGELHRAAGREKAAQEAQRRATEIVRDLAATIGDQDQELRDKFLSSLY
jgi:DNA-binding SARP family transcriptional activator